DANQHINDLAGSIDPTPSSPTAGTGFVTVNGSEASKNVVTRAGTSGSGSVTISGAEGSSQVCQDNGFNPDQPPVCTTVYDSGSVSITVNGFTKSVSYGRLSASETIASDLTNAFNGDTASPVRASVSGATVTLTAKATGASTNYSLASSSASGDPNTFGSSFSTTASGPTLTGSTPDTLTLVYDAGSLSVTVNGFTKTASYGQGSTGASIASVLAGAFNADAASPVVASSTGNVVNLATKATGSNTNYPLSTSSATSSQY